MKKRLFIALNLSENVKDNIEAVLNGIPLPRQCGLRLVARENWHITVIFLGDQEEEVIPKIETAMRAAIANMRAAIAKRHAGAPHGKLQQISYGPSSSRPRMVWARVSRDASDGIGYLKKVLEEKLAEEKLRWESEDRTGFDGHITLARFTPTALKSLPHLQKPLNFSFTAPTLDLVSSELRRDGPRYTTIAKIAF